MRIYSKQPLTGESLVGIPTFVAAQIEKRQRKVNLSYDLLNPHRPLF